MPLLPLDTFREIIGYNPWHFWGLANSIVPVTSGCNDVVYKWSWQNVDAVGRQEILDAIETAESRLREYLGFSVAPRYRTETIEYPSIYDKRFIRANSVDGSGQWASVILSEGKVQAIGVESLTLIGNANVTFSDADGDGLDETWTASIATTETDTAKIAVYFTASDRLDSEGVGDAWRIQPVQVSISGGTATVRGRSWLLVKPIKYEGFNKEGLDPDDTSNLVSQVAIYKRTTDPDGQTVGTSQGVLYWETEPYPSWALGCCGDSTLFGDSSTDPAAVAQGIARVGIRDAERGIVFPGYATYNSDTSSWESIAWGTCRPPDRVLIRYLAGEPLVNGQMNKTWQTIVARLAAAEMPGRICACDAANRQLYHWQFDMSRAAGANDEQYSIGGRDLENPLGTKRGEVYAWKQIQNLRQLRGVSV